MKKTTVFVSIFLLCLFACKNQKDNSLFVQVDINPTSQPIGSLKLSDIVEQIEYIPLETNENCIVGNISDFDVSENYIAISVFQTKEVFLFSKTGRFVAKIEIVNK